jgi:uncharacterized phage protein (TIGR02220 family)
MCYRIKNWSKHQHHKDRRPPWIKIHREILDDPDWFDLTGEEAKHLIMLWLIASEDEDMEGKLPSLKKIAFRLRISESKAQQTLNKLSNFLIQDDIKAISRRYQGDIKAISRRYQVDAPETETETEVEKEKEKEKETATETTKSISISQMQEIIDYMNVVGDTKYHLTDNAKDNLKKIYKEGFSLDQIKNAIIKQYDQCKRNKCLQFYHPKTLFRNTDNFERALNLPEPKACYVDKDGTYRETDRENYF